MADTYLTLDELNILFQELTISMLGMDASGFVDSSGSEYDNSSGSTYEGDDSNPYYFVRISWPRSGQPAFKIDENVAFLRIFERDHPYNRQRDSIYDEHDQSNVAISTGYTRIMTAFWNIYGPLSYDWACTIRDGVFLQRYRNTLAVANIYPVPDIAAPRRAPDLFQGQWWERCDLGIDFNVLTIRGTTYPLIKIVDIHLVRENGEDRVIPIIERTVARSSYDNSRSTQYEDSGGSSWES